MLIETPCFEKIPQRISRLPELAYNLWWCWQADARKLFRTLDRASWRSTIHNPVRMLLEFDPDSLAKVVESSEFLDLYDDVVARFDRYMTSNDTWFARNYPDQRHETLAYFCAEFAVHTSVPIYSGGLGLLAGDTCKEASDLGVPLVAIGALYPEGYFKQSVSSDGSQEVFYERVRTDETPLLPVRNDDGSRLIVTVPLDGRELKVVLWRLQVGRIPIFLIDSDIPENEPWDRDLVARLYAGDNEVRLRQEIVLGMGGVKALRALGYNPVLIHLNEGHASFAALELIREHRNSGMGFQEALEASRQRLVFTTHTPVKAGHDEFPFHMMEEHFRHYWEGIGISREEFLELGSPPGGSSFSMTVLALRAARSCNGVSRRHGEVSREMWRFLYRDLSPEQIPITYVTNGVHVPTWLSGRMVRLFESHLGADWSEHHDDPGLWEAVERIPDELLWETHLALKKKLDGFMKNRARWRWMGEGYSAGQIVAAGTLFDPEILTLGFARRFATYKRAALVLRDRERLRRILMNRWKPVQIVFSGKPHPADEPGKYLLRLIYEACVDPMFGGRIAFLENYDKHVAHYMVSGVDVWLNNPEPPKEASGTSGQKASLNGVLNFSVLDGWWCEGYDGSNGWTIEGGNDEEAAQSLYRTLETEIVPLYYDRDSQGIPHGWVRRMKAAIRSLAAPFSARRMMKEYLCTIYYPDR